MFINNKIIKYLSHLICIIYATIFFYMYYQFLFCTTSKLTLHPKILGIDFDLFFEIVMPIISIFILILITYTRRQFYKSNDFKTQNIKLLNYFHLVVSSIAIACLLRLFSIIIMFKFRINPEIFIAFIIIASVFILLLVTLLKKLLKNKNTKPGSSL